MKIIKKVIMLLTAYLTFITLSFADETETIDVSVTIGAGVSTLSITGTPVVFNNGQPVSPIAGASRFESNEITVTYFAANGPWKLGMYTTRADKIEGLADKADGESNVNAIPLKFTTNGTNPNNELQWSGSNNDTPNNPNDDTDPRYFWVVDDGAVDDFNQPFYFTLAKSEDGAPGSDSIDFRFATDVAGGTVDAIHEAEVTVILEIL